MLTSSQYISGFQMLVPCRSHQGIIIVRLQSFTQYRVIITLYEMINEPRLKTEPTLVLNASYEIKNCLLLNDLLFLCCFHVFFFVPQVDVNRGGVGVQISNIKLILNVAQWVWMVPLTISLIPLEIPYPQSHPCLFFFWNSPFQVLKVPFIKS